MKEIQKIQLQALDRIGAALTDLGELTNPFDIEAKLYFIKTLAQQSHDQLHALNSEVPHKCEHGVGPKVFDAIFGKGLIVVLAAFMMVGCHSRGLDRLLGKSDDSVAIVVPAPLQIAGLWSGSGVLAGDITIDGHLAIMSLDVPTQSGANVSGAWALFIDNSDQPGGPPPTQFAQGTVAGTIDANGLFTYTLTESPACPEESHGTGQVTGNSMAVSWTGTGNPGCALWFDGGSGTLTK